MFTKILAGLTAVVLSLGLVSLTATSASAHHNTIGASVVCHTGPEGSWKVVWTVKNSESDKSETIVDSSNPSLVPIGTGIAAGATATFVQYFSTKPSSNVKLELEAEWSNGQRKSDSATVTKNDFDDACLPDDTESKKIDICHASEGNGWNLQNVSVNSIISNGQNGHDTHADDIIPPFDYVKHGGSGSYPGKNWDAYGQAVFAAGCTEPKVTATAPTFTEASCIAAGQPGQANYSIPSTTGVGYSVRLNGTGDFAPAAAGTVSVPGGTQVEVIATAQPGYVLHGTVHWKVTFANPDCIYDVVPTAPQFTAAECLAEEPGEYGKAAYTIPATTGVQYQVRKNSWGPWSNVAAGTYAVPAGQYLEIRARALDGDELTGTTKWVKDFSAPDCDTDVTPIAPTWTEAVCTGEQNVGPASFTIPAVVDVQYYRVSGIHSLSPIAAGVHEVVDGSLVRIHAAALDGYEFDGPDFRLYVHYFDNFDEAKDCLVPQEPTFDPQVCTGPGDPSQAGFTIPSDTGVRYQIWDGGAWLKIGAGTYDVDTFPTTVQLRAVAKSGYSFLPGTTTTWTEEFTSAGDCVSTVPVEPAVDTDQQCVVDIDTGTGTFVSGWITIPGTVGVDYFIDGVKASAGKNGLAPGTYEITAAAQPGYALSGYGGPYDLTITAAEPCGDLVVLPSVVPLVTFAQTTCAAPGSYTLAVDPGELAGGVDWTVTGGLPDTVGTHSVTTAGTVTVTAVPAPGYGFADGKPGHHREWRFDFTSTPDDCLPTLSLPTLALTGGGIASGALGLAALLMLAGVVLVARRRDQVTAEQ